MIKRKRKVLYNMFYVMKSSKCRVYMTHILLLKNKLCRYRTQFILQQKDYVYVKDLMYVKPHWEFLKKYTNKQLVKLKIVHNLVLYNQWCKSICAGGASLSIDLIGINLDVNRLKAGQGSIQKEERSFFTRLLMNCKLYRFYASILAR